MNVFPADFPGNLTGFGGDRGMDRARHRASIRKTPVILVHGNGGHSAHPKWGMETLRDLLKAAGYRDCEIWAMDYLGENNGSADLPTPHTRHIEKFRIFVDRVAEYLGVGKLDFIAHSLGCGMTNGYLRGLQSDGRWNTGQHRLDFAGTFVSLAGATYGLGPAASGEFKSGGEFETSSHRFDGVVDDTPKGQDSREAQTAPVGGWVKVTELDDDQICYVAISAAGDFIDIQNPDTGRREGADLNARFSLGNGLDGHEKIIKSSTVFNAFKDCLNRYPPALPARITIDMESGIYGRDLQVTVTVEPAGANVRFRADCVTRRFEAGFIVRTVEESRSGTLASGQSLSFPVEGMWEVEFSADGAEAVLRTYAVAVAPPLIEIVTDNTEPFEGTLNVSATTTKGSLYHGTDREHWMAGSEMLLSRTATVSFIALDTDGIASAVESRAFVQKLRWDDQQTASLTAHFLAHRLGVADYVALGNELGFNAVITLYLVDGRWVRNPDAPGLAVAPRGLRTALHARPAVLVASQPSGKYPDSFEVTISAPAGEGMTVYYTEDGSDPADRKNDKRSSFETEKTLMISGNGNHAILCHIEDGSGPGKFESFAWSISK